MSTKLISFYQNNPPDLKQREYLRGLGLRYSDAEVGEPHVGRMMSLPPATASSFVKTDSQAAMQNWLNTGPIQHGDTNNLSHDLGVTVPKNAGSFVAPLLWLPGVLRSQGPWADVMKETLHGTVYGLSHGVDLIKQTDEIPLSTKAGSTLEQQLFEKERLIGEMERALAKQKSAIDIVIRNTKELKRDFSKSFENAKRQEKTRHEKELEVKLQPLKDQLKDMKEDYSTLRKAHKVRVKKAYAQDNFISQYSKALSSVKQMARDIANKEQAQLRNTVGALERRMERDTQFKLALKKRTETAEQAAEQRYAAAENKIPKLESQLLQANIELDQAKRCISKSFHAGCMPVKSACACECAFNSEVLCSECSTKLT